MRKNADLAITFNTKQKVKLKLSRWNSEEEIDAALLIEEWRNEINPRDHQKARDRFWNQLQTWRGYSVNYFFIKRKSV